VAQVVLELAHQELLRLPGAEPGHPLELAELPRLLRLQLLARVVQVAPPVLERALALHQLLRLKVERALLRAQPLLDPRDLGAAREELLLERVARPRDRRRDQRRQHDVHLRLPCPLPREAGHRGSLNSQFVERYGVWLETADG
jgi:hypothetical protein